MVCESLKIWEWGTTEEKLTCQQNRAHRKMERASQTTFNRAQRGQGAGATQPALTTAPDRASFSADQPEPAACPPLRARAAGPGLGDSWDTEDVYDGMGPPPNVTRPWPGLPLPPGASVPDAPKK